MYVVTLIGAGIDAGEGDLNVRARFRLKCRVSSVEGSEKLDVPSGNDSHWENVDSLVNNDVLWRRILIAGTGRNVPAAFHIVVDGIGRFDFYCGDLAGEGIGQFRRMNNEVLIKIGSAGCGPGQLNDVRRICEVVEQEVLFPGLIFTIARTVHRVPGGDGKSGYRVVQIRQSDPVPHLMRVSSKILLRGQINTGNVDRRTSDGEGFGPCLTAEGWREEDDENPFKGIEVGNIRMGSGQGVHNDVFQLAECIHLDPCIGERSSSADRGYLANACKIAIGIG